MAKKSSYLYDFAMRISDLKPPLGGLEGRNQEAKKSLKPKSYTQHSQ